MLGGSHRWHQQEKMCWQFMTGCIYGAIVHQDPCLIQLSPQCAQGKFRQEIISKALAVCNLNQSQLKHGSLVFDSFFLLWPLVTQWLPPVWILPYWGLTLVFCSWGPSRDTCSRDHVKTYRLWSLIPQNDFMQAFITMSSCAGGGWTSPIFLRAGTTPIL